MGNRLVFLVDTHVVVWLAGAAHRISNSAAKVIDDARAGGVGLSISDVTLFEISNLSSRKRIEVEVSLDSFLEEVESRFIVLPIDRRIAARSTQFPASYPNDPMDRIIGATAIVHGLTLITADEQIRKSKLVNTVW